MSHRSPKPLLAVLTGERGWREIARPLQAVGHTVEIIDWEELRKNCRWPRLRFVAQLWTALRRTGCEQLFTDMSSVFLLAILVLGKLQGATVLMRLRGDLFAESRDQIAFHFEQRQPLPLLRSLITYGLDLLCLPLVDRYLPVSHWIVNRLGIAAKSAVVRIPCDPATFTQRQHLAPTLRLLAVTNFNYPLKVAPMGAFFERSAAFLRDHHIAVCVAGTGIALQAFRDRFSPQIEFLGHVNPVTALYSQFDGFIHLSGLDAFPYVVLEAQAAGLPVIVNNACGMLEQVEHDRTGLIVALDEPAVLERQLLELQQSPALRARLGAAGRQAVAANYSLTKIGRDLAAASFGS